MNHSTSVAQQILIDNDRGGYTVPSKNLYPYQWNWDSAFVALGFATFDEVRAWQEIDTLFKSQWPSGMVPHIIFWQKVGGYFPGPSVWQAGKFGAGIESSGISQPPVAATTARLIFDSAADKGLAKSQIESLLPKLDRFHQWWHQARDPKNEGVMHVSHPWESGRDNLPDWDEPASAVDVSNLTPYERTDTGLVEHAMRPNKEQYDQYLALVELGASLNWDNKKIHEKTDFWVADVACSAILIRAERDLLALAKEVPDVIDVAAVEKRLARLVSGFKKFWNQDCGAFCNYNERNGRFSDYATSATFLCFYADVGNQQQRKSQIDLLEKWSDRVQYLVPSYDPFSPEFDHIRYWRGPIWSVVNFMIGLGLGEQGETAWSKKVNGDTRELAEEKGYFEYFSPIDGSGCGGDAFSWTAAIDLHLKSGDI